MQSTKIAEMFSAVLLLSICIVGVSCHYKYIMSADDLNSVALVEFGRNGIMAGECIYETPEGDEVRIAYEEYTDVVQAVTMYEDNTNTEFHYKKCKQEAEAMSAKKFNEDEKFRIAQLPLSTEERQKNYYKFVRRMQRTQRSLIGFLSTSGSNTFTIGFPTINLATKNFTIITIGK